MLMASCMRSPVSSRMSSNPSARAAPTHLSTGPREQRSSSRRRVHGRQIRQLGRQRLVPEHAIDQHGLVLVALAAPVNVRRDDLAERLLVLGVSRNTDGLGRFNHAPPDVVAQVRGIPALAGHPCSVSIGRPIEQAVEGLEHRALVLEPRGVPILLSAARRSVIRAPLHRIVDLLLARDLGSLFMAAIARAAA